MATKNNNLFFGLFILFLLIGAGSYIYTMQAQRMEEKNVNSKTGYQKTEAVKTKTFNAQEYQLDNGLKLYVVENHRVPVVTHMVWYGVGAADEPRGQSGIAHFLEHLMFKGHAHDVLGNLPAGEFSKIVRGLGGEDNAFTSQDYTAYFQSIASEHLEKVMMMEAGRMRGMNPLPEDVASENKVIQEERRQRTDNDPRAQMREQLVEALFPNHPYSVPIIGWMHEIEDLTWEQIKAFYDIYYAPNNAIVVVSGDVSGDEVFEIAKRSYGLLTSSDTLPERKRTKSPSFIAKTAVSLSHDSIKEPVFQRIYRTPSYRQNKAESLALQVLEEIIGGGSTSRLYKSLVIDQKLATNVSFSYRSSSWDDSMLYVSTVCHSEEQLQSAKNAIDDVLRDVIQNGVREEEASDAIERLKAEAIYAMDSVSGPAMILGYNLITGMPLEDIEYWPYLIENVSTADIQAVATKYLNPDVPYHHPPVEGVLLPLLTSQKSVSKNVSNPTESEERSE